MDTSRSVSLPPTTSTLVPSPARALLPLCAAVFAEFLAMGLPLPILPGRVHGELGLGALLVGAVIGAQSWATLLTRHAAGTHSDHRGPAGTATLGLAVSVAAGLIVAASGLVADAWPSLAVLLVGRVLLGLGESLVVTAALGWGVALVGRERSGRVMSWVGIAMYAALALGAPLGTVLAEHLGFAGVSLVAAFAPLLGILAARAVRPVAPALGTRLPMRDVAAAIALPGAGLSLSALGFGAIVAYGALRFEERGWPHAELAMTAFGGAYVLARALFGGLPDRFGGARVALGSAALVAVGQLASWLATSGTIAVGGAALTGLGFSLAFPSFGIEAIRRVPPQSRGAALGAYAACFDLTMGIGVPLVGGLVDPLGRDVAFVVGTLGALAALGIAAALATRARSAS